MALNYTVYALCMLVYLIIGNIKSSRTKLILYYDDIESTFNGSLKERESFFAEREVMHSGSKNWFALHAVLPQDNKRYENINLNLKIKNKDK